ncbi:MAG: hypothetical protein NTW25_08505 [Candidatus Kapabacteria bacterium]|nr:hypothetical protein [Candidatus Kapabacteria bacterium]
MLNPNFICFKCKHFNPDRKGGCKAFPNDLKSDIFNLYRAGVAGLIPVELISKTKHKKVIKGQFGDYVFEPIEEKPI